MSYDAGQIKQYSDLSGVIKYENWFFVTLPYETPIEEHTTYDWCIKNCEGKWARDRIFKVDEAMYFIDESDQIKFILWM